MDFYFIRIAYQTRLDKPGMGSGRKFVGSGVVGRRETACRAGGSAVSASPKGAAERKKRPAEQRRPEKMKKGEKKTCIFEGSVL